MRQNILAALLIGFLLLAGLDAAAASPNGRLITQQDAAQHGLKRAWFTQIRIDPGRSRVSYLRLFEKTEQLPDTLFVQTDQAVVHALDAETGQTLWVRAIGNRAHPTLAIGANAELVGVINGTRLYLLDRSNGRLLWQRRVEGVPADGPVLTDKYIFVPMISGLILAYPITKEEVEEEENIVLPKTAGAPPASEPKAKTPGEAAPAAATKTEGSYRPFALKQEIRAPLACVSFGRITSQPIFTLEDNKNQYLAWSTTRGLFVGYVDLQKQREFAVQYQLKSHSEIVTQPTYLPPAVGEGNQEGLIFSATGAGEIRAFSAMRGTEVWNYAIGQPVVEPIIPIVDRVYVAAELGGLFCIEAVTGRERWSTGDVSQFIAASPTNVYVADRDGQLRVLDGASGARVDGLFTADLPVKFRNLLTDRIYLATPTGLVQCLHETALDRPVRHRSVEEPKAQPAPAEEPVSAKPAQAEEEPAAEQKPAGENPFDEKEEGGENPFGQ